MLHLNIIKVKTPEEMGKAAADEFEAVICRKPACVMGLATGSTPLPLYRELIAREQAGKLDFSRVRSANLDEYKGLAPDHPQSYRRFMQENLFDHISIKPENTIVPDGPVSYTHLAHDASRAARSVYDGVFQESERNVFGDHPDRSAHHHHPVSYTHLDVYKRQGQGRPEETLVSGTFPLHGQLFSQLFQPS